MKRYLYFIVAALLFVPGVFAQGFEEHINAGVFGNYIRLSGGGPNLAGVGGRVSFNVLPIMQFEAETTYNFEQTIIRGFTTSPTGSVSIQRTSVRALDGLFGPKLTTNKGPVRLFVTAKGGFINFNVTNAPATLATVGNAFANLQGSNVYGVFYPGGGAEAFWRPIGLRFDIGDEIYFRNGGHNNLRLSFGPTIRF